MKISSNLPHLMKCFYRLKSPLFSNFGMRVLHISAVNRRHVKLKDEKNYFKNNVFFARNESKFYHRILENDPNYSKSILKHDYFTDLLANTPDTHLPLDGNLSELSSDSVLPYMATLTRNLIDQKLDFSSPELISFANFIKRNVKSVRKDDLPKMLSLMYHWPVTNKLLHPSMSSIIFALDYACGSSALFIKSVPVEETLLWMEPWHWLGLCTMSEFVQMATGKLFWKADKKEHIVQLLFYMSELRTLPNHYDRPSIEKKVIRYMRHFSCNEVGILAAGFYKSSTKVTNYVLYKQLVKRVLSDTDKFHDISLNAVLKLLRATFITFKEVEDVVALHKALFPLVPTLSGMCLVQTAMLGTSVEVIDRDLMMSVLSLLCEKKSELREKDFQRVMYACAMGLEENDVRIFVDLVVDEIHKRKLPTLHLFEDSTNNPEVFTKLISFIEAVLFLHILGYKSSELVASAIDIGNHLKMNPKMTVALHHLDVIVDMLYPDYSGPRLSESAREAHYKFWFPNKSVLRPAIHWFAFEWRETTPEMLRKFYLDVCDTCGGNSHVASRTLIPFYEHKDIVVCTDLDGNFVPVPPEFGTEPPWKVQPPTNTNDKTFCVLMLLRDRSKSGLPDYTLYQKLREKLLRCLGYRIAVVRYKVFEDIPKDEKLAYIREAIKTAK